jgi:hypothetical protein
MIKTIVIFYTKILPEYIGNIFQRNQNRKMGKLDDTEDKEQTPNWIEDFDEREKNWK